MFLALTGDPPFRWQSRLFTEAFAMGRLPAYCDVPTGLGKTCVMALWLIARTWGAALPRRLVYVVDRRAVVDQATRFAERLQQQAKGALGIADLPISTLRGQFADNRLWLEDPTGLAIIVGTVDMVGSRLLFEGYGVSRGMRPYQAGLLGADALFVLDEAHLCPAFEQLLRQIATDDHLRSADPAHRAIVPQFYLLSLSATGRTDSADGFRLTMDDKDPIAQPIVHQRVTACKRLRLHNQTHDANLETLLVERARELGARDKRVVVFCHSHEMARRVEQVLRGSAKEKRQCDTELLVGARRVRERQNLATWLWQQGFAPPPDGSDPLPPRERPAFLVATAAGEVGIDFDADHMVSDLVAYERMVQRLGRVNRRGGAGREALIDVFCVPPKPPKDDAKPEVKQKFQALLDQFCARRCALAGLRTDPEGHLDASPEAFAELKSVHRDLVVKATTPEPLRPPLDRALIEAWSLTSLREHPGRPEPGPWLRGWTDDEGPQTTVIWRRWLPWRDHAGQPQRAEVEEYFATARPHANEVLATEPWRLLDVLIARAKAFRAPASGTGNDSFTELKTKDGIIVLTPAREFRRAVTVQELAALTDKANKEKKEELEHVLANATVIISAALGGLASSGLLDQEQSDPPLCLDNGWGEEEIAQAGFRVFGPDTTMAADWRLAYTFPLTGADDDALEQLRVGVLRAKDGPQTGNPAVSKREQSLAEHTAWVANEAAGLAKALDLEPAYEKMLCAAAFAHDTGKARELWQNAMRAPRTGRPYAKTTGRSDSARLRIGELTYRHEFGSLADARTNSIIRSLPDGLRDLALHLIAAHHGHARPAIAQVDPDSPSSLNEPLAGEAALRFVRLQRQWGPWGLAWWEAVFRAADQRASRRLSEEGS